jgi:hypothetical protein
VGPDDLWDRMGMQGEERPNLRFQIIPEARDSAAGI